MGLAQFDRASGLLGTEYTEGISLFAESNFRLFQHEGVISVPLEESPVLRIGFAYKKAGEYTPAMDCFYILWQIHRNIEWFSASTTDVKP